MTPRVVSPYRPFPPQTKTHVALAAAGFDWVEALRLLAESVQRSNGWPTLAITDIDTDLGVPTFHYRTDERRLMLWILEVSLRYLESDDFDRDTVFISPDMLVYGDLSTGFQGDLGVLIRPRHVKRPVLNGVQWWSVEAKDRLVELYRHLLTFGGLLDPRLIKWGADCEAFRGLLAPLTPGLQRRGDLLVQFIPANTMLETLTEGAHARLDAGQPVSRPMRPIVDFRYTRKRYLTRYAAATHMGVGV